MVLLTSISFNVPENFFKWRFLRSSEYKYQTSLGTVNLLYPFTSANSPIPQISRCNSLYCILIMLWSFWTSWTSFTECHDKACLRQWFTLSQLLLVHKGYCTCSPVLSNAVAFFTRSGVIWSSIFFTESFRTLSIKCCILSIKSWWSEALLRMPFSPNTLPTMSCFSSFISPTLSARAFEKVVLQNLVRTSLGVWGNAKAIACLKTISSSLPRTGSWAQSSSLPERCCKLIWKTYLCLCCRAIITARRRSDAHQCPAFRLRGICRQSQLNGRLRGCTSYRYLARWTVLRKKDNTISLGHLSGLLYKG